MKTRLAVVGALLAGVALLGGCSSKPSTSTSGSGTPGAAAGRAPTGVASPSRSSEASSAPQPAVVIHTGTVLIAEAPRNVLTDAQGFTLYYHTADTSSVVCSGSCASTWPPLTDASGTPTASPPLPGQLGVRDDENGRQVTYNGHPLYRYSGDKGPGQANGQGVGKLWYVAPPALQAAR